MTYVVTENCIKCKYVDCVEVCPVDCFYEGDNMPVIHHDECIECGVCEAECLPAAIIPDSDAPVGRAPGGRDRISARAGALPSRRPASGACRCGPGRRRGSARLPRAVVGSSPRGRSPRRSLPCDARRLAVRSAGRRASGAPSYAPSRIRAGRHWRESRAAPDALSCAQASPTARGKEGSRCSSIWGPRASASWSSGR